MFKNIRVVEPSPHRITPLSLDDPYYDPLFDTRKSYDPNYYPYDPNYDPFENVSSIPTSSVPVSDIYVTTIQDAKPTCPRRTGKDIRGKVCQAAIFDKSFRKILIVYEKNWSRSEQRWGLPKGKFKVGEVLDECLHREVCEEVGLDITAHPILKVIRLSGRDRVIILDEYADNIKLYPDAKEIADIRWVDIEWLMHDIDLDRKNTGIHKYNSKIRNIALKLRSRVKQGKLQS
jgi:ADP-ribose pyrophosphatase YjhB (NUDIX family)